MKKRSFLILIVTLMAALILSGCAGKDEPSAPTPSPEPTVTPATPSPAPPAVTEPPLQSDAPGEATISIHTFLEDADIRYLSQSTEVCGAVTNDGRVIMWPGGPDPEFTEAYRTDGLETIYAVIGLENITEAWMTDNHICYTNFVLDGDGRLWGFGSNRRGLMPGYEIEESGPVVVMEHVVSFAMGRAHQVWAAAVTEQHEVLIWGWLDLENIVPPTVIATDAVSAINSGEHLRIITTKGELVDLGMGRELMQGNVERTLVKEHAVWGDDDYVLGDDGVLYYHESDGAWTAVADDVKTVNYNGQIAFYLTNTGELFAWESEVCDWFPDLHLPASPAGEKYIKLLDGVAMAAPADLGSGIYAVLENGDMLWLHIQPPGAKPDIFHEVPDVISIYTDRYPNRYDLTKAERRALWEMLRDIVTVGEVPAEHWAIDVDNYNDNGEIYEGYCQIVAYNETPQLRTSFQFYPKDNIIYYGPLESHYYYSPTSVDFALIDRICDVPPTIYDKSEEDIQSATAALTELLTAEGNTVSQIWYDEALCSAIFDVLFHPGPGGKRNELSSPENHIVLLYDFICGPNGYGPFDGEVGELIQNKFVHLVRDSAEAPWEFVFTDSCEYFLPLK